MSQAEILEARIHALEDAIVRFEKFVTELEVTPAIPVADRPLRASLTRECVNLAGAGSPWIDAPELRPGENWCAAHVNLWSPLVTYASMEVLSVRLWVEGPGAAKVTAVTAGDGLPLLYGSSWVVATQGWTDTGPLRERDPDRDRERQWGNTPWHRDQARAARRRVGPPTSPQTPRTPRTVLLRQEQLQVKVTVASTSDEPTRCLAEVLWRPVSVY